MFWIKIVSKYFSEREHREELDTICKIEQGISQGSSTLFSWRGRELTPQSQYSLGNGLKYETTQHSKNNKVQVAAWQQPWPCLQQRSYAMRSAVITQTGVLCMWQRQGNRRSAKGCTIRIAMKNDYEENGLVWYWEKPWFCLLSIFFWTLLICITGWYCSDISVLYANNA